MDSSPVISPSLLEGVKFEEIDWFSIPEDQRIVSDEILDMITDSSDVIADLDKENEEPPAKRFKPEELHSLEGSSSHCSRFEQLTSSPELAKCSKGFVPPNTQCNTQWAVRTFNSWMEWRNQSKPKNTVPQDILSCTDPQILSKWLSLFIIEARKKSGEKYPTSTLNLLLCGLKRHMCKLNPNSPNFLDEKHPDFAGLRGTRDCIARQLREEGIGVTVKHTPTISIDEEEKLWTTGVLGVDNPQALLNAMFFMNGKVLCLRGGREHKALKISQFTFHSDGELEYVIYIENGSKNRSGSYKEKADSNKVIKHFANPSLGNRCYVTLLKLYLSKLPPKILNDTSSVFYWKPKEVTPVADVPWFTLNVIGRNTLGSMVKKMCEAIGVEGKTNHSLRATGASRLFERNVPEKLIQERTGHKSTDALRQYERTSTSQQKDVSDILCSSSTNTAISLSANSISNGLCQGPNMFQNCSNCTINVTINSK